MIGAKVEGTSAGSTAQRHGPHKAPSPQDIGDQVQTGRFLLHALPCSVLVTDICYVESSTCRVRWLAGACAEDAGGASHRQSAYLSTRLHPTFSLLDRGGYHRVRETKARFRFSLLVVQAHLGKLRRCRTWPNTASQPRVKNAAALPSSRLTKAGYCTTAHMPRQGMSPHCALDKKITGGLNKQ